MTAANNTPRLGNPPGEARLISLLPRVEKKKGRQPRDGNHRRKRTLIRTHFRVRGTTILAWRRRSGLLRVEKEKEAAEQSREKGRGRENGREWRRAFPL